MGSCYLRLHKVITLDVETLPEVGVIITLENLCTRTEQSSRVGCSWQVHKIVYMAVKMGTILVNILLLKIFFADYCHL